MAWYFWLMLGWATSGCVALGMQFCDQPRMRENVGWAEVWPAFLGPVWLVIKSWEWLVVGRAH